ncbi:carboxylesterase/lipase family protein [Asticcacaulis excentricus]|uniref:Carboxylic ester hydrolase n=1 Tax=Asticcacaulis excentricus (strain ATCC 15261 / DSM 4724 / KCTC 12464 / NCIMB 9791 / VKM B-1370 / CB 48) TaxID=573065 RepID=E8RUS5_ASTEC|nr:carboxylesterase family protein [Asticcacaulis excentricus]ADU14125.1 Carboxylesterase type B [Asticcacaulis excentricus CB 48]
MFKRVGVPLYLLMASSALAGPVVTTSAGRIEGTSENGVSRYLGIPFATPPVGDLRWRAPQPVKPWSGLLEARSFGPDCVQMDMENPPGPGFVNPESEDCLYLNVWAPENTSGRKRPVMVWIYGGAFIMGAASYPSYDGTAFARQDVVMVSLNYRVGRFGFFAHPELKGEGEDVGNYGLMDQIKALEWVRDNIAAFGGDPANVTIFGESAGASSVNFLMASPKARGLFHKAIAQSGGTNGFVKPLDKARADGKAWGDKKGATTLAALRALPAAAVLDAPVLVPESVIADGQIVRESTPEAYKAGHVADIPYLVGANDYEESLIRWLPGAEKKLIESLGTKGEGVVKLYMADGTAREIAEKRLWGEYAMTLPARWRAEQTAQNKGKVWLYRFSYVPETLRAKMPGAGHENEIEMVFDIRQSRTQRHVWTAADLTMARTMNRYWANFAKTGDPNGDGLKNWPRYTVKSRALMHFAKDGIAPAIDFEKARLDALEAATVK